MLAYGNQRVAGTFSDAGEATELESVDMDAARKRLAAAWSQLKSLGEQVERQPRDTSVPPLTEERLVEMWNVLEHTSLRYETPSAK